MEKMKKFASKMSVALKVINIFAWIVAIIFMLLVGGLLIHSYVNNYAITLTDLNLKGIALDVKDIKLTLSQTRTILWTFVIGLPIIFIPFVMILKSLKKLILSIKNERPFTSENVKAIKTISILVYVAAFLATIVTSVVGNTIMNTLNDAIGENIARSWSFRIPIIDIQMLFISAIIYLIALVFEYGTKLQEESDTTL